MSFINAVFGYPLGWVMWLIYKIIPIYGIALILFTLAAKLLLLPLSIKQQKSLAKQQAIQPRMAELQNRYKNNKEKLNEEMMKLYEEEHFNPMSGCLPLLIQFPILFGLIDVIYNPLKHLLRFSSEIVDQGMAIVESLGITGSAYSQEITLINAVKANPAAFSSLGSEIVDKIVGLNFNFLGIDLTLIPPMELSLNPLILIPIISGVSSLLISLQSLHLQKKNGNAPEGGGMMKGMMLFMPFMSLMIAFQVPAGVGMYWAVSNLFSLIQSTWLNKKYNPREMAEKAAAEAAVRREEERRKKQEAKAKLRANMTEAERQREDALEAARQQKGKARAEAENKAAEIKGEADEALLAEALSEKEKNRRKLAEARRRDAERYGEEYVEVTDDDLK